MAVISRFRFFSGPEDRPLDSDCGRHAQLHPKLSFWGIWIRVGACWSNVDHTPVVNPQYVPNQSVLTPFAASYFNTVVGQVEYGLSRRSSWTASGSYGIVRYPDSDLYNTNQLIASTGYNRSLTAKDSIFGTYNYSQFSYLAYNSNFTSQNVQFGYARKVTGRMSFRVTAGPEFTNAIALGANQKQIQFSGSANLAYSRGYTDIGLSYFAGATGGSGVMTGAQTQNVQFTIGHSFSRAWTTSFSAGYSNNSGLVQQQSYNSVYLLSRYSTVNQS